MNIDCLNGHKIDWSKNTNDYFYVYNRACGEPIFRHKNLQSALNEAARLSSEMNKNFYVLQPVCKLFRKGEE